MRPIDVLEHVPVMIGSFDRAGRCTYVNPAWLAFSGRALEAELGDGWRDLIHDDDQAGGVVVLLDRAARGERVELELRLRRPDGAARPMRLRGEPSAAGWVVTFTEPSDGAGDSALFELSLDLLCVAGFDGYWQRLNPAWTRTLGWTTAELMARPLIEFCHPDDREATLSGRRQLHRGEPLRAMTNRYRCKDGSYRWLEWRSVSDLERQRVYAIARDVTADQEAARALDEARRARGQLERQLVAADRLASVGTLAAGVAHEINNPLAYVTANLDLLIEDLAGGPGRGAGDPLVMARDARQGAERIRKIVGDLKTFARVEDERRAAIELAPVLALAIDLTRNEIRHRARLVTSFGEVPRVEADDSRLAQVVINLLVNAAQALGPEPGDGHEIRVVTTTDGEGRAVIEVHDTGPGIPPDQLERIFEPFFTTKPVGEGTGLGLSISHNLVVAMGGQLTAANRPEGGAVLRVILPAARAVAPATPPAPAAAPTQVCARRAKVLVVDDEPRIGAILRRVLRGHDVVVVTSARDALARLATGNPVDVIFSDVMMPGMSGLELHQEVVQRWPALAPRIVFMTGGAFAPQASELLERTSNPRIEKPFSAAAVRALVARFVDQP